MIPNPIFYNDNMIMAGIVICCLIGLAVVMIPKAIRHRKRIKENTNERVVSDKEQEVQTIVAPKDEIPIEKAMVDYKRLFIVNTREPRNGKLVGIRMKYHKRIAQIVEFIGEDDVSIFSYLDNVLKHHFETYHNEISEHYKNFDDDYLLPKK